MKRGFSKLLRSSSGAVAVVTAFVLPLLIGFGSLGIEVGHWYLVQREMQGAADAAAISASAQYIADQIAGNTSRTTYQQTGQNYAGLNGFTIPVANTCLVTASGDDCGLVRALDTRPIVCSTPPCVVVEITQDTFQWLSTKASMEPNGLGNMKPIPTPTLAARSIVAIDLIITTTPPQGTSCILTLANDRNSIQVRGNGDIHANCGLLIDGGRDQNARTPNINSNPLCSDGGLTLSGHNAMVHITNLTVAASTAGPAEESCPDPARCFLYNPATTVLPTSAIFKNTATPDPYAGRIFTKPAGVVITAIAVASGKAGSGYTNGIHTFTVQGGTGIPAKFTATVSGGKISSTPVLIDPGQYTTLPTSPISVSADDLKGSGANYPHKRSLSSGCEFRRAATSHSGSRLLLDPRDEDTEFSRRNLLRRGGRRELHGVLHQRRQYQRHECCCGCHLCPHEYRGRNDVRAIHRVGQQHIQSHRSNERHQCRWLALLVGMCEHNAWDDRLPGSRRPKYDCAWQWGGRHFVKQCGGNHAQQLVRLRQQHDMPNPVGHALPPQSDAQFFWQRHRARHLFRARVQVSRRCWHTDVPKRLLARHDWRWW